MEVDSHIPNHPSLPPQLICQLHNMTMHVRLVQLGSYSFTECLFLKVEYSKLQADVETDEVYAQMTLQPLNPVCHFFLIGFAIGSLIQ